MKLITQKDLIRSFGKRFKKRYADLPSWYKLSNGKTLFEINEAIKLIDINTATVEDIITISGSSNWTDLQCDECGNEVLVAVYIAECQLCETCIKNACDLWKNPYEERKMGC